MKRCINMSNDFHLKWGVLICSDSSFILIYKKETKNVSKHFRFQPKMRIIFGNKKRDIFDPKKNIERHVFCVKSTIYVYIMIGISWVIEHCWVRGWKQICPLLNALFLYKRLWNITKLESDFPKDISYKWSSNLLCRLKCWDGN